MGVVSYIVARTVGSCASLCTEAPDLAGGSLDATMAHPREVFKAAIIANAAAIVIGHSHPSGDPTPSFVDLALTARLVDAGHLLGLRVLDHVIIGYGNFVSLRATSLVAFHGGVHSYTNLCYAPRHRRSTP